MSSTIPLGDLRREYARYRPEIDVAIERVLQRGWFVLGSECEAFEAEWAAYCGAEQAVGVGSGTDALHLALRASGIGPGDEVIVPALGSAYTALAVSMAGATLAFADVDPETLTLSPSAFEAAITPRTAAVIPVHLYGCPVDLEPISEIARRHSLWVLEDGAHAHGARYRGRRIGTLGDCAAFSFYPTQNLGAYGDAGAVVTSDAALAERVRVLRNGGQRKRYRHDLLGTNSRLDEIQAAVLRTKLPHLEAWNQQRQRLASRYRAGLGNTEGLKLPTAINGAEPVYHRYTVQTAVRDALQDYLGGAGISTSVRYPVALHLQEAFAFLGYERGAFPLAEAAADQVLSLPLFPQLSTREVDQVIRFIRIFFAIH